MKQAIDAGKQSAIEELFSRFKGLSGPGVAIGLSLDGEPYYLSGFGCANLHFSSPITAKTVFHVASLSKQFTAFAIALLVRENSLRLDDDIRTYLHYVPDFGKSITIRHLIHHTSGLRDQWRLFSIGGLSLDNRLRRRHFVNVVSRQRELNFEPGTEWSYSNTGYTMLADIVAIVAGRTFREFTRERIFEPLSMSRSFFFDDVTEIVQDCAESYFFDQAVRGGTWGHALLNYDNVGVGATSLFSTAEDMTRWARNFGHTTVGDRALIDEISAPSLLNDGTVIGYGYGLERRTFAGHEAITHGGADAEFRTAFAYFPAADFSITLLANHNVQDWVPWLSALVDIVLNGREQPRVSFMPALAADDAIRSGLEGHYIHAFEPMITIERRAEAVYLRDGGGEPRAVNIRDDGTFDTGNHGRFWRINRDLGGDVQAIENLAAGYYGNVRVFDRHQVSTPSPAELRDYCGNYRCPELDVTYHFETDGDGLTAETLWAQDLIRFVPVKRDRFDSDHNALGVVEFMRDKRGAVTGFLAHGARTRHVCFERLNA